MNARALGMAGALGLGALLAAWPALAAPPDVERGARLYARCVACHALSYDRVGPRHCGLFGRKAGTVEGFDYSPAMRRYGVTWNERTLDRFLAAPMKAVPGTTMTYDGVPDPQERADLIAYLQHAGSSEDCRGAGAVGATR